MIKSILNNDPSRRPTINEILASDWINYGHSVPTYLPASTLACPPSHAFIRQWREPGGKDFASTQPLKGISGKVLDDTALKAA